MHMRSVTGNPDTAGQARRLCWHVTEAPQAWWSCLQTIVAAGSRHGCCKSWKRRRCCCLAGQHMPPPAGTVEHPLLAPRAAGAGLVVVLLLRAIPTDPWRDYSQRVKAEVTGQPAVCRTRAARGVVQGGGWGSVTRQCKSCHSLTYRDSTLMTTRLHPTADPNTSTLAVSAALVGQQCAGPRGDWRSPIRGPAARVGCYVNTFNMMWLPRR
jgi:hypothetical protein